MSEESVEYKISGQRSEARCQHTPGPWKIVRRKYQKWRAEIQANTEEGQYAASIVDCSEWLENAQLIAAAPDMLSVLEQVEELLSRKTGEQPGIWHEEVRDAARAAIAKAKGRSNV